MLTQVLSSFECLSTWDKVEKYYVPGDDCKLVNRCPDCGTLTKERERKIRRESRKIMGEKKPGLLFSERGGNPLLLSDTKSKEQAKRRSNRG
jgi:hypothetical protein